MKSTARLFALSLSLVAAPALAADKDWGGANLTINANMTLDGIQSNIGNLLIVAGVTVTVTPGLALEFDAVNVDVQGTIDATATGFTGGGAGTNGAAGTGGLGGQGPGGGGKGTDGANGSGSGGAGGGGGGHGGNGGSGGKGYSTCNGDAPAGGTGGSSYGSATAHTNEAGSGGGGGGGYYSSVACTAPNVIMNRDGAVGGAGGGQVTLVAQQTLNIAGSILAVGGAGGLGGTSGCGGAGSGSGGGGGGILVDGATVKFTGTLDASGGIGGGQVCAGVGCGMPTKTMCNAMTVGQAGGGGRIKIFATSLLVNTGTTSVAGSTPGTMNVIFTTPSASLAPAGTTFASQRVGTTSPASTVTVKNTGNGPLVIANVFVAGTNPGDFTVKSPALPWSIPAMSMSTFTVTFTPTAMGPRSGTVQLSTNDVMNLTLKEQLSGAGVMPVAMVMPAALHFGSQQVGLPSMPQIVTLMNSGTDVLNVTKLAVAGANAGDFALSGVPNLPFTVAAGASLMISVTFTPPSNSPRTGEIDITDDSGTQIVSLDGKGAAPRMVVTPLTAFGSQRPGTTTMATITITNQGVGALTVSKITLAGAAAGDYMLSNLPMLPATVAAGSQTTFTISFTPSALGGRAATVTISGSDANNPNSTVTLLGTGVQPALAIAPASVSFPDQATMKASSARTVTLTNLGTDDLHIANIVLGGANAADFALLNLPKLPATVKAGTSTTFDVTFTPTAVGARSAQALVQSDDPNTPMAMVPLSGNGIAADVTVTPMALDFKAVQVGLQHAMTVVIVNNSGSPVSLVSAMISGSMNFTLVNPPMTPYVLAPNAQVTFAVGYQPTAVALDTGKLTIVSGTMGVANFEVPLTGSGVTASFSLDVLTIDFGALPVGQTSLMPKTVTLSNTGGRAFNLTTVMFAGHDSDAFQLMTPPSFPLNVPAGGSTMLSVVYKATAHATQKGTLLIETDVPNTMPGSVALTGMGLQANLSGSPTKFDFGTVVVGGSSGARSVTVTNIGDGPLMLATPQISGAGAAGFKFDFTPPAMALAPGAMHIFTVSFIPPSAGGWDGVLELTSPDQTIMPVDIPLVGTGFDAHLELTPTMLDFGAVPVFSKVGHSHGLTLVNRSMIEQQIMAITSDANDFHVENVLPLTLPGGGKVVVAVSFLPTAPGPQHATISIDTQYLAGAGQVPVAGTGVFLLEGGGGGCSLGSRARTSGVPIVLGLVCVVLALRIRRRRSPPRP